MKTKTLLILPFLLAAAVPATAGLTDLDNPGPAVTSVSMRQRYPWNGLMDVDVTFEGKSGETYRIELSALDMAGGTNLPVRTAWLEGAESAVGNPVDVPAPGTHRLVWNAGADLPAGFVADRVTVSAKLLNPIWSFANIPEIDPDDVWAPETVYHDVQTVAAYGEIEDHEPTVRCLTDEWNLEASLGANVVFSGSSMGLRFGSDFMEGRGVKNPIALWTVSAATNRARIVTLDYESGRIACDAPIAYAEYARNDARFFAFKNDPRAYAVVKRGGYDAFWKSAGEEANYVHLGNRYADDETGSALCSYFPKGIPVSDETSTTVPSSYDKNTRAAVFFCGESGTDRKQAVIHGGGSPSIDAGSKYSCMGNAVGRYVVPLLDGNTFFTVACEDGLEFVPQHFRYAVGRFDGCGGWSFISLQGTRGWCVDVARSKAVAMPDGGRIFFAGVGRSSNGRLRMWCSATDQSAWKNFPTGHPFESWARRDVTCLLPNGKFCGVDEELGLVVVNPLTGETYVASDDPAFKKGKMGCQLLPNGKVWIIPYDCEGREFEYGRTICGKLYEVDFGFTRSFSLSSLCSPYLKVAEGAPEPSGIKVGLYPSGGKLPGVYAQYYKGENPVYGELPVPVRTGCTFLGWSPDATAENVVSATDPVPPNGIQLKAVWNANGYSVRFNANTTGTTGSMSNESFTYGVAKALTANAFAKTGYRFAGWARTATGAKAFNDKQTVSNLTASADAVVDLYALWSTNRYAVRFNKNAPDATGTMADQTGFTYGIEAGLRANAFSRSGYTFAGWARTATGAKEFNDKQKVLNLTSTHGATVDLYAVWTANGYSVRFNANTTGTTGSMSNESFTYGVAKALTANAFAKTGYRFAGWARTAAGAKAFNDKQTVSNLTAAADAVVDLYALWSTNRYAVRFNKNAPDATGTMADQTGFTYGIEAGLRASAFSRSGYTFAGWARTATGAKEFNDKQKVLNLTSTHGATVDLYAVWTANGYSVKFNANTTGTTGSMSNESFTYGVAKALTANAFAKTGYRFAGWARTAAGAKAFNDKQTVSNLTATAGYIVNLYALWSTNTYTVRFNKNASDATGTMANQGFTYDRASALRANAFSRTGWTFSGWATNAAGAKVYNDKQSVSNLTATHGKTVDLYAVWTANTYSVKFNANTTGTTGSMSNESFTYGVAKALTANAFSKTGYRFAGWARTATGAKAFNDKQTVSNLTATAGYIVNLYALWSTNTYTVRFNKNASDATGTMANQGFTYDRASALRANAFSRTGWTFSGWATSASGAKVYNDKQSVSNLTATHGATVDLYAVWERTANERLYMVVDLSRGPSASSYPVSYLSEVPEGGWTDEYQTTKLVLRYVEPGTFMMGSPSTEIGRSNNETLHQVTLTKPFYIGVFACSRKQWELVTGNNPSEWWARYSDATLIFPMSDISYNDIRGSVQGANWPSSGTVDSTSFLGLLRNRTGLDFDLPTEAQWEYACRAGTTTSYNLGFDLPSDNGPEIWNFVMTNYIARCSRSGSAYPAFLTPSGVGIGYPNQFGLYAMHGNSNEWCLDWYSANLGTASVVDPVGPSSGASRVCRGGSSTQFGQECRSASRLGFGASMRLNYDPETYGLTYNPFTNETTSFFNGFRLCLPVE